MNDKMILLKIIGIREIRPNAYVTLLSDIGNTRRLPIVIGATEARAIAFSIEGIKTERPITHDLIITLLTSFGIELEKVSIVNLEKGVFYAEITMKKGDAVIKVDARPSDAIAIALRFKRPIFCTEEIMNTASIETEFQAEVEDDIDSSTGLTLEDLKYDMQEAVKKEDYESAAEIKKMIEDLEADEHENINTEDD